VPLALRARQTCSGIVKSVSCLGARHIATRWDENGGKYSATADDAAYANFPLAGGVIAHFNSSWCVRVRRDDLVTFQVDGTRGSAVAGLTRCFNPVACRNAPAGMESGRASNARFLAPTGRKFRTDKPYDNAFKAEWEAFHRHVCEDTPFKWNLLRRSEGAQLVELRPEILALAALGRPSQA